MLTDTQLVCFPIDNHICVPIYFGGAITCAAFIHALVTIRSITLKYATISRKQGLSSLK